MTKHNKYSEEQIREAVKDSFSIRQVLSKLGLSVQGGGSYRLMHKLIAKFSIDTSHFTGQLWTKSQPAKTKRNIQDYLTNKQSISSHALRLRLLRDKIFEHKCSCCQTSEWQGKPIPLELDHIDGNHFNNELKNIRLLCPNCHAQTPNHAGKNKGKGIYTITQTEYKNTELSS